MRKDNKYAKEIMAQFHTKMSLDEVRDNLSLFKTNIQFYNECLEKFEYPVSPCSKGYNRIFSIPLPNHNWWLGKGNAQFYFYFDSDQRLVENMYELYYPRQH